MKKQIISLFSILTLVSVLLSCNFTFKGDDLSDKPDVEAIDDIISISIPYISETTKYIIVYRKDAKNEKEDIFNAGILYTSPYDTKSAYTFFDKLIYKDTVYKYRVRYYDKDGYTVSGWSNEVTAKGGYPDNTLLQYKVNNTTFLLNEGDYSLKVQGNIENPANITDFEKNYVPMLVVTNGTKTEAFKLETLENGTVIALRGRLPEDFIDVEIKILGIVGQITETEKTENTDTEAQPKTIHWTPLSEVEVYGFKDNKFKIPSLDGKDGIDYSKKISN